MAHSTYIPAGWPAVIPRIAVDDPEALVVYIKDVFGAKGAFNSTRPTELWIESSLLMVSATVDREPMNAFLYVYVEDADAVYQRALAHGGKTMEEPRDMQYGDRRAMVRDPWGNAWQIATYRGGFTP